MTCNNHTLRSVFIITLQLTIMGLIMGSKSRTPAEEVLQAVCKCMTELPARWPEAWQSEYQDTILWAVAPSEEPHDYVERLSILSNGFPSYWRDLIKSRNREVFEVQCAQIRWYIEYLMSVAPPAESERQRLRAQWKDLWDFSIGSLLTQFPFLDPNAVQKAQTDHLRMCYHNIEAPLQPVFMQPFSSPQIDQTKQRWHDLRYARIDLLTQLGGKTIIQTDKLDVSPGNKAPPLPPDQEVPGPVLDPYRADCLFPTEVLCNCPRQLY